MYDSPTATDTEGSADSFLRAGFFLKNLGWVDIWLRESREQNKLLLPASLRQDKTRFELTLAVWFSCKYMNEQRILYWIKSWLLRWPICNIFMNLNQKIVKDILQFEWPVTGESGLVWFLNIFLIDSVFEWFYSWNYNQSHGQSHRSWSVIIETLMTDRTRLGDWSGNFSSSFSQDLISKLLVVIQCTGHWYSEPTCPISHRWAPGWSCDCMHQSHNQNPEKYKM